ACNARTLASESGSARHVVPIAVFGYFRCFFSRRAIDRSSGKQSEFGGVLPDRRFSDGLLQRRTFVWHCKRGRDLAPTWRGRLEYLHQRAGVRSLRSAAGTDAESARHFLWSRCPLHFPPPSQHLRTIPDPPPVSLLC